MESGNLRSHYTIYLVTIVIVFEEKISKSKEKIFKSGIYRNL